MAYGKGKQYLYRLTFPNGMVYIGSTFDIKSRWAGKGYKYRDQDVYEHIIEFGWDNIKKEVLLRLPDSWEFTRKIEDLECELIKIYGDKCYNKQANPEWHQEQARKRRENGKMPEPRIYWTVGGITKPAKVWCEEFGKDYGSVVNKMQRYKISAELALQLPRVPSCYSKRAAEFYRSQGFNVPDAK